MQRQIEADWMEQAKSHVTGGLARMNTRGDAAGAVDGIKDGKYAFHTGSEPNPWWQVDLGESRHIARVVVYNRLDYAPGLHNADHLGVLTSTDGETWTVRHENQGKHFGGISGAAPLDIAFTESIPARFLRLQIRSAKPIFFHLDEVEVYAEDSADRNIALGCAADQSSVSIWSTNKLVIDTSAFLGQLSAQTIKQGQMLSEDLKRNGVDTSDCDRLLAMVAQRLASNPLRLSDDQKRELFFSARWAVRRLALSNPLLDFEKLLIVKKFTQETYPDVCLNHMPWVSRPGGDICILSLAGAERRPCEETLLNGKIGPGHVHGLDLDWDARKIVFGYAKAKSEQPAAGWLDRQTNYDLRRNEEPIHLFEIGVDGQDCRQLTDGQWSDLDPTYLPNGDIAFVSERCGCSLQCNEFDKDETSCNIYVMRADGSSIRRLSASKDGDYLPHALADGSIGYCRWEYQERGWAHVQSIWTVRPDGTGADALFKQHMNDPWAIEDARSIPGTDHHKLVAIAAGHHTLATGPVVIVTPSVGMNDSRAIRIVTPNVLPPEGGMSGTPVPEGGVRDGGGFYSTPWPLSDKYFLAAYSYSDKQTAPAGYGIYLIDVFGNKELIFRDSKMSCFTPIPLRPRPRPPIVPNVTDSSQAYATCAVADATHGVAGISAGQARYLRISERLVWPYDNLFGGHRYHEVPHTRELVPNWTPVRVLGEVPLEADGSAHFRIPADVPVYFQLLDENHMELRRMRSFISLQPGESRMCVGCHETRAEAPPTCSTAMAVNREPSILKPPPWGQKPVSFLRDIQPIFDRHCTKCHAGLSPAGQLDFSGGLTARGTIPAFGANRAYETIRVHELVARSNIHDDAHVTAPLEFGSDRSRLVRVLREGACGQRAPLNETEWLSLITWIDANAPYHSNFINKRRPDPPYDLPADRALIDAITAIHARRCQTCHDPAAVSPAHWIDLQSPEQSRFLTAPLAKSAGGSQRCSQTVYRSQEDQDYVALVKLVKAAVQKAWNFPRRDLRSLQLRDSYVKR